MNLGKVISVIGKEIAKDMVAKENGPEAVKHRQQVKKEQSMTGMTVCLGIIAWTIIIAIVLSTF